MSICKKGLECKSKSIVMRVLVDEKHPLIRLSNAVDWQYLAEIVLHDLKATAKGFWWLGRRLVLRSHLGAYLIQQLFNLSDRQTERHILDNAVYQVFCGASILNKWHCPDHTKIEEFRSRLSPETQCALANAIAHLALRYGFAKPQHIDIDSTVQEPDMQYPATVNLLVKTGVIAKRVHALCFRWLPEQAKNIAEISLKKMMGIAKEYYFIKRKRFSMNYEMKDNVLKKLWIHVSETVMPIVQLAQLLTKPFILNALPSRSKNLLDHFTRKAPQILSGLFDRCFDNLPRKINVYSYFRDDVHCFNKMKHHKACEFGRQFQIGRLQGNFIWSIPNSSVLMSDAASVKPMMREHLQLFQTMPESIATDKAYYSKDNEQFLLSLGVESVGLQRSNRKYNNAPDNPMTIERQQELINRRAGIEPIIGHLKRYWQMGRSRMKSDQTTESSGFCAILGFNLRQLMRYLNGEVTTMES